VTHELLDLATLVARRAGELLLEHYHRAATGVDTKSTPTDLVSDADRAAEHLIKELIAKERPDDGLVGEESGRASQGDGGEFTWIIDPLDGTVNFLFRIPTWAVSIAVRDREGLVAAVVHDPNRNETFTAQRSGGAALNGAPIRVGDKTDLSQALVGTGFAYDAETRMVQAEVVRRVLPRVRDIRRAGSAALDLSYLACGRLDGFYEAHMMEWDKAAGILLVEEAGGVLSPLEDPSGISDGLIGANRDLHPALERLVRGS
jgi:myo-inositol-1(or 4)-monophosphatase